MPVFTKGIFDVMLGYSLKRDYLGDSLNWRNIETFNFEVQLTDMPNVATNVSGFNYLSTYITGLISTKLNTDKKNITIRSIDIPNSNDSLEDLIRAAKYNVTAEVRKTIDQATLLAQHPELDDTNIAAGQDGEDHKFRGVKDIFLTYAKEIDSISESFSFEDKEDGSYNFSHNIELGLRPHRSEATGATLTSSKVLAGAIATALFVEDSNALYFGHNAFTNALTNFGNSANNRHYFDESYDTFKGKYSFTKKMAILPLSSLNPSETAYTNSYTQNKKYSLDWNADGKVTVTETTEIKSRNANWTDIRDSVPDIIDNAYSHCLARLSSYTASIDGQGANSVSGILFTVPISQNVTYDPQGLRATVTVSFSSDPQIYSKAQQLETIEFSKDHRGVVTATYSLTLTSHEEKTIGADRDVWVPASCSNSAHTNKTDCQNNGGTWTPDKTPLDILKSYETTTVGLLCSQLNFMNLALSAQGVFWNTLSYWWPAGSDHIPYSYPTRSHMTTRVGCGMHPVSTTISAPNMGKAFTLNKTFTNDTNRDVLRNFYPNAYTEPFKKLEIKWNDTWPQQTINEHPIINRGTSWLTSNQPHTSVLADAYNTKPGKRSVTINATLKRPVTNNLTNPVMPTIALETLAYEARQALMQVFLDDRFRSILQMTAYVSNISYTYNSANEVTATAELTYTVKFLPSTPGSGSLPSVLLPPSKLLPPLIP